MEFEFYDTMYVELSDIREMYLLCRDKGYSPEAAIYYVACGWDDVDYYKVDLIFDQLVGELNYRLKQTEKNKLEG